MGTVQAVITPGMSAKWVPRKPSRWAPIRLSEPLGGPGFSDRHETDKYVKLVFTVEDPEPRQITRTYTVRKVDPENQSLDLDFVVHGTQGVAGPWAAQVQAGARISLRGPGGG